MAAEKNPASFSVARYELINIDGNSDNSLLSRLVKDLTGGDGSITTGAYAPFKIVFPTNGTFNGNPNWPTTVGESLRQQVVVILESLSPILPENVPMGLDQSWRIRFEYDLRPDKESYGWLKVNVGTRNQILDDGTITETQEREGITGTVIRTPGEVVDVWFEDEVVENSQPAPWRKRVKKKGNGWFKRVGKLDTDISSTYPMSYRLTVVPHGIALFIWDNASITQNDDYSWLVIQRQVSNITGITPSAGKFPLHCIYECSREVFDPLNLPVYYSTKLNQTTSDIVDTVWDGEGNEYSFDALDSSKLFYIVNPNDREDPEIDRLLTKNIFRFVVREFDVFKPWDVHKLATHHQLDSHAIINPLEQLSVTPDNRFVITFPTGLTTERFMYPNHEIDLIAFSSAEVVSQGANIPIDSYKPNELTTDDRTYQGMYSTLPNGNGMRVLVHVNGGTIPDDQTDVIIY